MKSTKRIQIEIKFYIKIQMKFNFYFKIKMKA